jgi:hypothetical protein
MDNAGAPVEDRLPILAVDFDGVLHSYGSGWLGADRIPDPPTPGAMRFLAGAVDCFDTVVVSSRLTPSEFERAVNYPALLAMQDWLFRHLTAELGDEEGRAVLGKLRFLATRPPAHVTLDDRAITFCGTFPDPKTLRWFEPWTKRERPPIRVERADLKEITLVHEQRGGPTGETTAWVALSVIEGDPLLVGRTLLLPEGPFRLVSGLRRIEVGWAVGTKHLLPDPYGVDQPADVPGLLSLTDVVIDQTSESIRQGRP